MTNKRTDNGDWWRGERVHPTHRRERDGWGTRSFPAWGEKAANDNSKSNSNSKSKSNNNRRSLRDDKQKDRQR
jgi:hypothetical protein